MYSNRGWSYSSFSAPTPTSAYRRGFWRRPKLPRLPSLGPLPFALLLVGGVAWYHFSFDGFSIEGMVIDADSGTPVSGARVWAAQSHATTTPDGHFTLTGVKPPEMVSADAPGYGSWTDRITSPLDTMVPRLDPVSAQIKIVDAETGVPITADVSGPRTPRPLEPGLLRVAPVQLGDQFSLSADGYTAAETTYGGQDVLRVTLQPRVTGRVTNAATGTPVRAARLSLNGRILSTNSDGEYELKPRPRQGQLQVLAPGFRRATIDLTTAPTLDVKLQPLEVRGTYMTYFAIGGEDYRQEMYRLLDSTEINAVVIDVKGDYGLLSYKSHVPLAQQIGADAEPTIDDPQALLRSMHEHGAYTIARIVVFKDQILAKNGPRAGVDIGVRDRRTGELWLDNEKLNWVDPFQEAVWDYNTALAREAIEYGFDEVQFDYIRFPTDPSPGTTIADIQFSKPSNEENRVTALKSFLNRAHFAVNEAGGYLSMDTFGYTTWLDDDGGIGQDLLVLSDEIDYYSPMVYPSTFEAGVPGMIPYPEVIERPYDVVFESLKHVQQKLAGKRLVVRPWLQYFDDYPWATKIRYDAAQIEAQKKAVSDSRSTGWMLWNAGSLFKRGGLAPK
jgi:hypothetical protein